MSNAPRSDPAERHPFLRWCYRNWRPTWFGRAVNRIEVRLIFLGRRLGPIAALEVGGRGIGVLEVLGRVSGKRRWTPVVIATVDGARYLVSMLGPRSDWVQNVEAAQGHAILRENRPRPVHLVGIAPDQRAPVLREYVRIATSGRHHFPVAVDAPLQAFQEIAEHYPVYRIDSVQ